MISLLVYILSSSHEHSIGAY
uniref:Uncharacterized protein n=1 Tax=Rhizophora mucronata TaxID=61149 RepID=A0A2P2PB96_RHIMU